MWIAFFLIGQSPPDSGQRVFVSIILWYSHRCYCILLPALAPILLQISRHFAFTSIAFEFLHDHRSYCSNCAVTAVNWSHDISHFDCGFEMLDMIQFIILQKCDNCRTKFFKVWVYIWNMRSLYSCPHCNQTSTRRWNLETHIKRLHGGAGRPIPKVPNAPSHSPANNLSGEL